MMTDQLRSQVQLSTCDINWKCRTYVPRDNGISMISCTNKALPLGQYYPRPFASIRADVTFGTFILSKVSGKIYPVLSHWTKILQPYILALWLDPALVARIITIYLFSLGIFNKRGLTRPLFVIFELFSTQTQI